MTCSVARYEALIQADVPQPAARRVVEALEADMTSSLATKRDVALLDQRLIELQRELDLKLDGLETRLLVKLGALITALAGVAAALQRFARQGRTISPAGAFPGSGTSGLIRLP